MKRIIFTTIITGIICNICQPNQVDTLIKSLVEKSVCRISVISSESYHVLMDFDFDGLLNNEGDVYYLIKRDFTMWTYRPEKCVFIRTDSISPFVLSDSIIGSERKEYVGSEHDCLMLKYNAKAFYFNELHRQAKPIIDEGIAKVESFYKENKRFFLVSSQHYEASPYETMRMKYSVSFSGYNSQSMEIVLSMPYKSKMTFYSLRRNWCTKTKMYYYTINVIIPEFSNFNTEYYFKKRETKTLLDEEFEKVKKLFEEIDQENARYAGLLKEP